MKATILVSEDFCLEEVQMSLELAEFFGFKVRNAAWEIDVTVENDSVLGQLEDVISPMGRIISVSDSD